MDKEIKSIFEEGQVLLFNKPLYWTSFDLVNKVRNILRGTLDLKKIKVGHAGTLDPLADGLMIICTGKATKRIDEFRDLNKEYIATISIGKTTPSYDLETETTGDFETNHIDEELIRKVLSDFQGEQKQIPPMHSAKLISGKRAYEFARQGIEKELEPVKVFFYETELLSYGIPETKLRLLVSKGTYIRSFARDFGVALKSGAHLSALQRTAIGSYNIRDAYNIENFNEIILLLKQNGKLYV